MGAKQTKAAGQEAGASPQSAGWRRTPSKDRSDILASLMLRSRNTLRNSGTPPPYQRRIGMIQEMMLMAQQGKHDEATEMLKNLRQDLGMESTSLDDVLYRYASFRNLVDPITHDLIISLAKYVHCPKTEGDALGSMEKVCRQLMYHLSPHSQGLLKRKPQACLKSALSGTPSRGTLDLSSIPLTVKDMERLCAYLHQHSSRITSLELGFTELTDEAFLLLLPTLAFLPRLETLTLNGNRLTRAVLKELTDTLKDPNSFPSITWIDLGNNVDIFSLPQPFLVSLRKRCPKQGNLPTIQEFGESQASEPECRVDEDDADDTNRTESLGELRSEVEEEIDGEMEIDNMMEELLGFEREVQGKEDEDDSMWTLEEQRLVKDPTVERRKEMVACKAEGEEDLGSQSSHLSCSSQSQHSSGAIEPLREDSVPDQLACHSDNPT
ncbi:leucine-rich repeat-containing protein 75A [Triplophysa rosa]|uniref:Leucine-rich repeat-containing protein 75A n=1 Tax=Triplophysa rosa TaxID=992332 RepID=A0A9W7WI96_TRIRA|nr:leucine-rich repeat-containing protein 75A [Triplophysa rosa]XP_057207140.1 leucine-rich repeat-containing protein 75A [Triplophysa rosa]KAI7800551.1 putative leucine-rich repeat-containing protein 75A [Triplophysa rosa]